MKNVLKTHKKKLIIALITIAACFYPPVAKFIPIIDQVVTESHVQE